MVVAEQVGVNKHELGWAKFALWLSGLVKVAPQRSIATIGAVTLAGAIGFALPYFITELGMQFISAQHEHQFWAVRSHVQHIQFASRVLGLTFASAVLGLVPFSAAIKRAWSKSVADPGTVVALVFVFLAGGFVIVPAMLVAVGCALAPIGLLVSVPRLVVDVVLTPVGLLPPARRWLAAQALPAVAARAQREGAAVSAEQR
jgi:hypothetical protein